MLKGDKKVLNITRLNQKESDCIKQKCPNCGGEMTGIGKDEFCKKCRKGWFLIK